MRSPSARWLAPAGLVLLTLVALLIAGAQRGPRRTFALGAPNGVAVARLRPGQRECEGPVTSDGAVGTVAVWGAASVRPATIVVEAEAAGDSRVLSRGAAMASTGLGEHTIQLARPLPGGRPVRICIADEAGTFVLWGSGPVRPDVVMQGAVGGAEFSLVLLSADQSLLSSLPTAFSRAVLWRPSWVGSWTFWLLLVAVLGGFGLAVVAVVAADDDDERPIPRDDSGSDGPSPSEDSGEDVSAATAYR